MCEADPRSRSDMAHPRGIRRSRHQEVGPVKQRVDRRDPRRSIRTGGGERDRVSRSPVPDEGRSAEGMFWQLEGAAQMGSRRDGAAIH